MHSVTNSNTYQYYYPFFPYTHYFQPPPTMSSMPHALQQNNVLRRSHKTEFAIGGAQPPPPNMTSAALQRERSFVKQSNLHKRRSHTMATLKTSASASTMNKPTMELYRPPNVRTDLLPSLVQLHNNNNMNNNGKLNVHAKEFTMSPQELQQSKSSGNLSHYLTYANELIAHQQQQLSKTQRQIQTQLQNHFGGATGGQQPLPLIMPSGIQPLMHSATSIIVPQAHRVNFQLPDYPSPSPSTSSAQGFNVSAGLKRSKSMIETQPHRPRHLVPHEDIDLGTFPEEHRRNLQQALDDPNALPSRTLMDLVKVILERVVEGIKYSEAGAKLCARIVDRERTQTFLESLLNTCQQWYQERDKFLRGCKVGDGTRFTAFMWFLTEMIGQLKRHQMRVQFEALQPELVLLSVLSKCCMACVSLPIRCLAETECLFFVLTSIGRDLDNELPAQLETLMACVRDGFLASAGAPAVRRTLLQLIELHASKWQLPGSSVLYYYPRVK